MPDPTTDRAAHHAEQADRILTGVAELHLRLADASPEERLELAAAGQVEKINADLAHSVQLAQAHALTALALQGSPVAEAMPGDTPDRPPAAAPRTGVSGGGAITTSDLGGAVRGGRRRVKDAPQA